ncbi:uncharacterized protein LOC127246572 [Andrographis paniculata]|uniref:uncharacterized protein LOC127246572 n=1 Tax=Andrographis paniculata TaxID=175694 RepID=UPI0021E9A046|nr:uncharacterized protein LOC127246572 [Andrographis paniculata]
MVNFKSRSNSFPTQSHSAVESLEAQLCRLKSSEAASTSASYVCAKLDGLRVLHEAIKGKIPMSSIQQELSRKQGQELINELLEGSLRLVDHCQLSRDIVQLTKESVQDLESSIRRNKGEAACGVDFSSYATSRNMIKKMINKCVKNLRSFNKNSTEVTGSDCDLNAIGTLLKEAEVQAFSALNSVFILLSGEKERSNQRSWSFLSKLTKINNVHSKVEQENNFEELYSLDFPKSQRGMDSIALQNVSKQLRASEMIIQELEEGLEAFFRSLVKTRVSLLNILSY